MGSSTPSVNAWTPPGEPDDSVFVFADESYQPRVAVAAVAVESRDVDRVDEAIRAAYEELQHQHWLDGLESFEEFLRRGFHATSDPVEVRVAFVAFLAKFLRFKSMIIYSDRTLRPDLSEKRTLMIAIDRLTRDVIRAYAKRPRIIFWFESSEGLDKYVRAVVEQAGRSMGGQGPEVVVRFGTKRDPDLLALPDYVLHIFNRWLARQGEGGLRITPAERESREFRAILGSLSQARSLDTGFVIRRTLR